MLTVLFKGLIEVIPLELTSILSIALFGVIAASGLKILVENKVNFDIEELAKYELTGGQIELVIKNTAYKIAVSDEPLFKVEDFKEQITKEQKGQFDSETKVGFF